MPPLGFPVFDGKFPPVEWNGFPGCETEVFAMIGLLDNLNMLSVRKALKAPRYQRFFTNDKNCCVCKEKIVTCQLIFENENVKIEIVNF